MDENFKIRLSKLQEELKAPKDLYNSFGKYAYRNAESILEAVKPLLTKYGLTLTVSDDVIQVGDRYYIRATATIYDTQTDGVMSTTAFAREPIDKKGMDDSQISGAASSYARKYALNGLLLLDDSKDADDLAAQAAEEQKFNEGVKQDLQQKASEAQKNAIKGIAEKHRVRLDDLLALNHLTMDSMTAGQATNLLTALKNKFGE